MNAIRSITTGFLLLTLPLLAQGADSAAEQIREARFMADTDLDEAESLIEEAMEAYPENPDAYLACGEIMGRQASDAVFSALSYAKKSLNCLKKATELGPEEPKYRRGLITFYLAAPGIAGGDVELAKSHIETLRSTHPLEADKATLGLLRSEEDETGYQTLLAQLVQDHPEDPEVALISGFGAQRGSRWDQALAAFQRAVASGQTDTNFYWTALYQVGRTAVLSEQHLRTGIEALKQYIEGNPQEPGLPSHQWAYARLAQLHKLQDDTDAMQAAALLAKGSDDKNLKKLLKSL